MMIENLKLDLKKRAEYIYSDISKNLVLLKEKKENRTLHFDIIEDDEINGKAWCEGTGDYIEINKGVIEFYLKYFQEVNEYSKNKLLKKLLYGLDDEEIKKNHFEMLSFDNGEPVIVDSKDMITQRTALMEIFVSRFILLHEMGHIFNGHCSYLHLKKNEDMKMYYSDSDRTTALSALDFRTLEMDADAFATTQAIKHIVYLYCKYDNEVYCKCIKKKDIFYWWAFAIRSHFLVCEDRFLDSKKYRENMRHLPSAARCRQVVLSAIGVLDQMFDKTKIDVSQFQKLLICGMKDAEITFNEIKCSNYNSCINSDIDDEEYKNYTDEVHRNWDKLVNEIKPHSRCPLFGYDY